MRREPVAPNALLESCLEVDGLIKPTLARLGIMTIGQMAAWDVREFQRKRGVGERKIQLLTALASAVVVALRGNPDTNDEATASLELEQKPTSSMQRIPLAFVPSILRSPLDQLGIRTADALLAINEDALFALRGWGHRKVQLIGALKELYTKLLAESPGTWLDQELSALVPRCFLPRGGIDKSHIGRVIAPDFRYAGAKSTRAEDFASLLGLIRLWAQNDAEVEPGQMSVKKEELNYVPPNTPLIFVPSILKRQFAAAGFNSTDELNASDERTLSEQAGWGTRKSVAYAAIKELYTALFGGQSKIDESHTLADLPGTGSLFDSRLASLTLREIWVQSPESLGLSGSSANDYDELRLLLRLAWQRHSVAGDASIDPVPNTPLVFVPSILRAKFSASNFNCLNDLNAFDEWTMKEQEGYGSRKLETYLALKELYTALFAGRTRIGESTLLANLAGTGTLFDSRVASLTFREIVASSPESLGLSGTATTEYDELRILLRLALLRNQPGNQGQTEPMSFLSPELSRQMHWKDAGLTFPARGQSFLDEFNLHTLGAVDDLAITGKVRCAKTDKVRLATEQPGFTLQTLQAIRSELLQLSSLGLDQYRYGEAGKPATCSDLVARIQAGATDREFEILRDRSAGSTLLMVADSCGLTRQRVQQMEHGILEKNRRYRDAANEILEPLQNHLRCHLSIGTAEAFKLVGAEKEWELILTAQVAQSSIHLLSSRHMLSLISSTDIDALRSLLREDVFEADDGGRVSVRRLLTNVLEANSPQVKRCQEMVRDKDLTATLPDFIALLGLASLIPYLRRQLVDAGVNGLYFEEIITLGVILDPGELRQLLGSEAELLSDGRFRRPGRSYTKTDEVVDAVRQAPGPITVEQLQASLRTNWSQAPLVNCLTERFETIQMAFGLYVHIDTIGIDRVSVRQISNWGAELLAGEKKTVDSAVLRGLYCGDPRMPKLENAYQLMSIIAKHRNVRRVSANALAHRSSLDESTLSLAYVNPEIAAEWHTSKNGTLTPETVRPASNRRVWWRCSKGHEYQATLAARTCNGQGCPGCVDRWTVEKIRRFVASLKIHIDSMTPAELYAVFQQSGLLQTVGKARGFVKALTTGKFPKKELDRFLAREPSLVDQFLDDADLALGDVSVALGDDAIGTTDDQEITIEAQDSDPRPETAPLPEVRTKEALSALGNAVIASTDGEAAEFLLASAKAKIWTHA